MICPTVSIKANIQISRDYLRRKVAVDKACSQCKKLSLPLYVKGKLTEAKTGKFV